MEEVSCEEMYVCMWNYVMMMDLSVCRREKWVLAAAFYEEFKSGEIEWN